MNARAGMKIPMDKVTRKILACSIALFAERGFARVTVRDITEACKIHMPTLYRKFGDKERLYKAVVREALVHSTAEVMHVVRDERLSREERLFHYVLTSIRQIAEQRPYTRILDRELLDPIEPKDLDAAVDEVVLPLYRAVAAIVVRLAPHADGTKVAFELASRAYAAGKLMLFRRHVASNYDRATELESVASEITQAALAQLRSAEKHRTARRWEELAELRDENKRLEALITRVMMDNAALRQELYGRRPARKR